MADDSDTEAPKKRETTILTWLARQKEVIVLISFFMGGVAFLYVNFVTQKQIKGLTCIIKVQVEQLAVEANLRERQRMSTMLNEEIYILSTALEKLSDHEKGLLEHRRKRFKEESDAVSGILAELGKSTDEMGKC